VCSAPSVGRYGVDFVNGLGVFTSYKQVTPVSVLSMVGSFVYWFNFPPPSPDFTEWLEKTLSLLLAGCKDELGREPRSSWQYCA